MLTVGEIFSDTGQLADGIEGFTFRPQQQQLAEEIAKAIDDNYSLICEAGVGIGKTFAYLIPALLSGKRIVISTGTKHLQDQLYDKDLPIVRKILNMPVSTAICKGRGNYLCLHRANNRYEQNDDFNGQSLAELQMVRQWARRTDTGDLAELTDLPETSSIFPSIVSNTENCLGQRCDEYDDCFVFKARRRANQAELVVVNHHLLLSDLRLGGSALSELLSKADTIIFDEAHQLPALASNFLSDTLRSHQLIALFRDTVDAYQDDANDMAEILTEISDCQMSLRRLRLSFGTQKRAVVWADIFADVKVKQAVRNIFQHLACVEQYLQQLAERSQSLNNCWRRFKDTIDMLQTFTEDVAEGTIQWLEIKESGFLLHQTPLDISTLFQERLSEYDCNIIYTSATLSVVKDFSYFSAQLGLSNIKAISVGNAFDYRRQALLYLPPDMPEPRASSYKKALVDVILSVIKASQGRAFLLFTSHSALRDAYALLRDKIDYPLLRQGDAPRSALLQSFRNTKHAILFGTSSFWEGVDVRGQALSCVIIDKLPFIPPNDPVFQARASKMRASGDDPFMSYQLPQAVSTLKQGVGRLIRDINDYGVLVICDPRIQYKFYGKHFLHNLPDMQHSTDIADVRAFFRHRAHV